MYNFSKFKDDILEVENWLGKEFSTIRTGMASPAILDGVKIESYGSAMPLNQVANIGVEDAKTLSITPWDSSQVKDIEKAIIDADLGVSVSVGGTNIRASFPDLTSERRELLIKTAKEKLEKSRISLRSERDKVWEEIQDLEKNKEISEDDKFRLKDEMQKMIDDASKKLEELFNKKEEEIKV